MINLNFQLVKLAEISVKFGCLEQTVQTVLKCAQPPTQRCTQTEVHMGGEHSPQKSSAARSNYITEWRGCDGTRSTERST